MRRAFASPALRIFACVLAAGLLVACSKKKPPEPEKKVDATPGQRYVVSADQQSVIDTQNRLEWKRCVEGRRFLMNACMGDTKLVPAVSLQTYIDQNATPDGWRLPTQQELGTIITATYPGPEMKLEYAYDLDIFPPPLIDAGLYYWTSLKAGEVQPWITGWYLYEGRLLGHSFGSDGEHHVRLVRPARK